MSEREGPYSVRANEGGVWAVTAPGTADLTVYKDHVHLLCGRLNEAYNAGRASQEPEGRALPASKSPERLNDAEIKASYNAKNPPRHREDANCPRRPDMTCLFIAPLEDDERSQQQQCRDCLRGPTRQDYADLLPYAEQVVQSADGRSLSHAAALVSLRDRVAKLRAFGKAALVPPPLNPREDEQ